jgi:hypothetical protein
VSVGSINGTTGHPIAYSFTVWAVDAAGNAGPTRVVAGNDTK